MSDYHSLLRNVTFFRALLDLDRRVALEARSRGCGCSGRLHWARYPRVPLGVLPPELVDDFSSRWSLCCAAPDCRKRTTPPSVCFLGRRQYIAATFVVLSLLRHGLSRERMLALHAVIPVDDRTLARWRVWWCRQLPSTGFWRVAAGRFAQPVATEDWPFGLLSRFTGDLVQQLTAFLVFLSDLSTTSGRLRSGITMAS